MAGDNEIRVVISGTAADLRRALEGAKGDLGSLSAKIKEVPKQIKIDVQAQTALAEQRLRDLKARAKDVPNRITIRADADTGVADAKLRLLQGRIRETETAMARAQLGGSFLSGGGPGLLSTLVSPFGSSAGMATAAVAGAPAIVAGVGAATAVAGSAGAGILGAGAIGTAGLGSLLAGVGPLIALSGGLKDAVKLSGQLEQAQKNLASAQQIYGGQNKQLTAAQNNYNAAVAAFGPSSNAARSAHAQLLIAQQKQVAIAPQILSAQHAIEKLQLQANPAVLSFATSWGKVGDTLQTAEQTILPAFATTLKPVLDTVTNLMPTLVQMARIDLSGITTGLKPLLDFMNSGTFRSQMVALSQAFAQLAGPLGQAFTSLFRAFLNVAIAASPYLNQIARAFAGWAKSFSDSLAPGQHLNTLIGGLVGQLRSWWNLATALGGLMVTIFSAGAKSGQGLVGALTGVLDKWNAWLNTKTGQEGMKKFFKDSADLVKALFSALAPLIGSLIKLAIDLMPTFTLVIKALTPVLHLAALAISAVADALKSKLVQAIAVAAIVFLPGGPIVLGLVGLGVVLGHLRDIVRVLGDVWRTVWGAIRSVFVAVLDFILGGFSSLLGALRAFFNAVNINLPIVGRIFGAAGDTISKKMGEAQRSIDAFRQSLHPVAADSKAQTDAIAKTFEDSMARIKTAMDVGMVDINRGYELIGQALTKELLSFGVKWNQPALGLPNTSALTPGPPAGVTLKGAAVGGYIGSPGEKGRDEVPIVVGRGEAILNHSQQQVANQFLAPIGGLGGLFAQTQGSKHYMAGGGIAGNVPAMIAEANRVSAKHYPYVWGGGHSGFQGPFDCSGAVSDILHAGGVLNAPRVSGDFMNYGSPGPGEVTLYANPTHVYMSIDGKFFGTSGSNPGGGAGWFPGSARPGFAVRHIGGGGTGGGGVGQIATPKWTGPGGALGQVGKAALAKAAAAANAKLSSVGASVLGGQFGGGQHSETLTGGTQALGQQMMLAAGWPMSEWPALHALWTQESGWDANAVNKSSGAYGIPQALGHGHPFALGDARAQIAWGLDYIKGRYGSPSAAEAHERAFNWYAGGGFAGGGPRGSQLPSPLPPPGSRRPRNPLRARPKHTRVLGGKGSGAGAAPKGSHPASHPPHAGRHTHTHAHGKYAPFVPKDALKNLLGYDATKPDRLAAAYARTVTVADQSFSNLLAAQATNRVDDPPLVTLTDADVAALDPSGALGYQTGDEIVNPAGMVAGRYFGPGGITGGTWHPGVKQRSQQIAQILGNRNPRYLALLGEQGADAAAVKVDQAAITQRQNRKARIEKFLHQNVRRASVIASELDVLKSKNLAGALKSALSKQSIARRLGGLRGQLRHVRDELGAEQRDQARLPSQARDNSHALDLQGQIANINDSIAVESQLGRTGSSQVERTKGAIYRHSLEGQLKSLADTNVQLGGKRYEVGTGGAIGSLLTGIAALSTDRDTRKNTLADFTATQLIPSAAEIAGYVKERGDLGTLANIQVRTPGVAGTVAGAAGPDLSALNALLAQQLQQSQAAFALSQAQFGIFQGFAPLLQGRLVGSYASGIDFVPATGPAMVHRGEMIIPDPGGPYGNRAAATVHTAQQPVNIVIEMGNDEKPLMRIIDARMNAQALKIVSDHSGQRARLLSGVRRA